MSDPFDFGNAEQQAPVRRSSGQSLGQTVLVWQKVILLGFVTLGLAGCCAGTGYGVFWICVSVPRSLEQAVVRQQENEAARAMQLEKNMLRLRYMDAADRLRSVKWQMDDEKSLLAREEEGIKTEKARVATNEADRRKRDKNRIPVSDDIEKALKDRDRREDELIKSMIDEHQKRISDRSSQRKELERQQKKAEQEISVIERECKNRFKISAQDLEYTP